MPRFSDRLSDRIRGKSCDEIIKDFRDEVDRDRKMFFDRDHHGMRILDDPRIPPEFRQRFNRVPQPFQRAYTSDDENDEVDNGRRRNLSGRRSDDGGSTASSGSATSDCFPIPVIHEKKSDKQEPEPRPKKPVEKSNTTDLNPQQSVEEREQRSSSAPPTADNAPEQPTFVSSMQFTPTQPESHKPVVRNVPIFVEGRDGPLPRVDEEMRSRSSTPVRGQAQRPRAQSPRGQSPSMFGQRVGRPQPDERFRQQGPAPQREFQIPVQRGSPQPQQPKPTRVQSPAGAKTPPAQKVPSEPQKPATQPEPQRPKTELERNLAKVAEVNNDLESLIPRIEAFTGKRSDKEFLYLDEMLTRLMIRLDDVTGDEIRAARKETIKQIQKYITLLESKLVSVPVAKSDSQIMEVEESVGENIKSESACSDGCETAKVDEKNQENKEKMDERQDSGQTSGDTSQDNSAEMNQSATETVPEKL